jgi:OFA family oxalate/formate antiporter-like MFS transporter
MFLAMIGNFFGSQMIKRRTLPTKLHIFLAGSTAVAGSFLASFTKNYYLFLLLYGVPNGFFAGMGYIVPVYVGWQYFPGKEGIISGVVLAGYGLGTLIFTYVSVHFINPDKIEAHEDPN